MTRIWWTCCVVPLMLCATEVPAFACSCAAISSFQAAMRANPVVVVGRVMSTDEAPPEAESPRANAVTVRPSFMGTGITVAIASVAKGKVSGGRIRIWDLSSGECSNALRGQTVGTAIVIALRPVADTPAGTRATWGAASDLPEADYLASSACGTSLQVLSADEFVQWVDRKVR